MSLRHRRSVHSLTHTAPVNTRPLVPPTPNRNVRGASCSRGALSLSPQRDLSGSRKTATRKKGWVLISPGETQAGQGSTRVCVPVEDRKRQVSVEAGGGEDVFRRRATDRVPPRCCVRRTERWEGKVCRAAEGRGTIYGEREEGCRQGEECCDPHFGPLEVLMTQYLTPTTNLII